MKKLGIIFLSLSLLSSCGNEDTSAKKLDLKEKELELKEKELELREKELALKKENDLKEIIPTQKTNEEPSKPLASKSDKILPVDFIGNWGEKQSGPGDFGIHYDNDKLMIMGCEWSSMSCDVSKKSDHYIIKYTASSESSEWESAFLIYLKNGDVYSTWDNTDLSKAKKMHLHTGPLCDF